MKQIISLLLCAVLLAACAGGAPQGAGTSRASMGRWVENEVQLNDENAVPLQAPVRQQDGTLALLTTGGELGEDGYSCTALKKWTSPDGAVWQEEAMDWPQGLYLQRAAVSQTGDLLFMMLDEAQERRTALWLWKAGGTPHPLTFSDPMLAEASFRTFDFLDENTLYGMTSGQWNEDGSYSQDCYLLLIDLATGETRLKREMVDGTLPAPAVDGGAITYIPYGAGSRTVESIDAKGDVAQRYQEIPQKLQPTAATFDAEGNYYLAGNSGVHRIARGGAIVETIFEGGAFAFAASNKMVDGLCRTADGDFLLSVLDTGTYGRTLYRYHFDETLPSVNDNQITVWSLTENATVRAALVAFGREHREITVNYTPVMTGDNALSREDLVRSLNTELLSGRGPDVLILDGVNYQPYISKGVLEDLSGAVDLAALKPELTEPFRQEGKTYVLPARFSAPILFGDPGAVEGLTSLDALQQAVLACAPRPDVALGDDGYYGDIPENEQYALSFLSLEQLVHFTLQTSAPALLDGQVLQEDALRAVLSFVQEVGVYYGLANYRPDPMSNGIVSSGSDGGDEVVLMDGTQEYSSTGHARYGWEALDTPAVLGSIYRFDIDTNQRFPVNVVLRPGLVEGAFLPKTLVGVNASSPQKEAALAFVNKLFSAEIQDGYYLDGTAVRADSFQKFLDRNREDIERSFSGDVEALYAGLKTPVDVDPTVEEKLLEHALKLCEGRETLEEAVAGMKNDLALYFAEQG